MARIRTYKTFTSILTIVVLGLIAYIVYSKFSPGENFLNGNTETKDSNALSTDGTTPTTPPTTINKTNEEVSDAEMTKEETIAQCAATAKKDAISKNTKYEDGTILVSFNSDVTYKQATDLLAVYKLKIATDGGTEAEFKDRHWLTVATPKGDEFKFICTLKMETIVKNAVLNTLFSIHY